MPAAADGQDMAQHQITEHPTERPSDWWVVAAWASLGLIVVGGLAGAAGLG